MLSSCFVLSVFFVRCLLFVSYCVLFVICVRWMAFVVNGC